jgi:glycerophosphoryl diester phosphodiesterase
MGCATEKAGNVAVLPWPSRFPVVVMAHRGFSGKAPENTLAAFRQAIEIGSDFIELDVRFSKDGHLVVFHDDTLERTTNGKGKVADFSLQDLRGLDAGSWFGSSFSGERIPTFQEVLDLAKGRILVNIELKKGDQGSYTMHDLADRALEEVQQAGMEGHVLFSSFDPGAVERIRKNNPSVPVALITGSPWHSPMEAFGGKALSFLNPRKSTLSETNLVRAHQQGAKIFTWTIDTEEEMEKFISMGVDGIITNHPDRLIRILEKKASSKPQISNPK